MTSTQLSAFRFVRGLLAFAALVGVVIALSAQVVRAADEDSDDDSAHATHSATGEKTLRRQYVGGRDEEELTVQAALPQPVRSPDAVPGTAEASSGSHD